MALRATVGAAEALSLLPERMCVVGFVSFGIPFVNAPAVDEVSEVGFIGPFVNGQAAFHTLEVSGGLLISMFIRGLWVLFLHFKQLLYGAGPRESLADWFVWSEVWLWGFMGQELAILLEVLLNDFHRQALMHTGVAGVALVPAPVGGPLVLVGLPWELALVDESFLVLLRVVSRSADGFVMYVMLGVLEDLLQAGSCLLVDAHVVLVEGFLPVLSLFVVECASSFVGCKGCIPLSPAEMGFVAGCLRCSCVFDVCMYVCMYVCMCDCM